MAKTLTISLPEAAVEEVELSDGRGVEVLEHLRGRGPEISWAARRPGWGDARGTSNLLIRRAITPQMGIGEIDRIDGRDRRRLMLAVIRSADAERDWQRLYGTSLSPDERFVAVMRWARERERADLILGLREARQRLIEQVKPEAGPRPRGIAGLDGIGSMFKTQKAIADMVKPLGLGERNFGLTGAFDMAQFDPAMKMARMGIVDQLRAVNAAARITRLAPEFPAMTKLVPSSALSETVAQGMKLGEWPASRAIPGIDTVSKLSETLGAMGKIPKPILSATEIAGWSASRGILGLGAASELSKAFAERWATPAMTPLPAGILGFGLEEDIGGLREQFRRSYKALVVIEYARTWATHPLWFLLDFLDPTELPGLVGQPQEVVFEAVLDALEVIVRDSELTYALLAAIERLPFLAEIQRQWLTYGLGHARRGEWVQAVANLLYGFEGALHSGAVHAELINPSDEGKLLAAEAIIKRSELSAELQNFAIKLAFGGRGNAFRHGRPETDARDQVLLILVALIGWIDNVMEAEGTLRLARELRAPLRQAIEQGDPQALPGTAL